MQNFNNIRPLIIMLLIAAVGPITLVWGQRFYARATGPITATRLWTKSIRPNADSAPAYLAHVRLASGARRPVVYVLGGNTTANCSPGAPAPRGTLYAFDAVSGASLWSRSTTGASRCTTAGPVVDPSGAWIYAPGLDGKMHRYAAGTGTETLGNGWPATITLMPDVEKMSSRATLGNGRLYVTTSGFIGDQGHYQGHLVSIDLKSGRTNVFNSLCSNVHQLIGPASGRPNSCGYQQSGLFGPGQGTIDPLTHDVFITSGNGPWNGRTNWGDSVLKVNAAGNRLLDAFTPTNQSDLANADADLGSSGPAILPPVHFGGHTYHLLVQAGKGPACGSCNGVAIRLLNRDNLSGRGGPGRLGGDLQDIETPGDCEVLTAPAVWHSAKAGVWVFYANGCGVSGFKVVNLGGPNLHEVWTVSTGGTTPVVAGNTVYVAGNNRVNAYGATSGTLLWQAGTGHVHWEYPLIAAGRLYITDESGHLSAYTVSRK